MQSCFFFLFSFLFSLHRQQMACWGRKAAAPGPAAPKNSSTDTSPAAGYARKPVTPVKRLGSISPRREFVPRRREKQPEAGLEVVPANAGSC